METLFWLDGEEITFNQIIKKYKLNRQEKERVKKIGVGYCVYLRRIKIDSPMIHRIR